MIRNLLLLSFILSVAAASAQPDTLRVLFVGNSYTYVNNLPQLTADLSANTGKTLLFDSSTPGGYSYSMHITDVNTLAKIRQGGWDAVILQEQSQIPTVDYYRYYDMYPAAEMLRDSILFYSPCARIITFMTWGRRFGGQQCISGSCSPVFTDFNHMQDSLKSAYLEVSGNIGARCAPVGMAWRKALEDPAVILHATDNSHPALNGSYLAAAVMYASIWESTPTGITYFAGVDPVLAGRFLQIADSIVFHDSVDWNRNTDTLSAAFTYSVSSDTACFVVQGTIPPGTTIAWDFGDGTNDSVFTPCHVYGNPGTYAVTLTLEKCGETDSYALQVPVFSASLNGPGYPLAPTLSIDRTSGDLLLQSDFNGKETAYIIYDAAGRSIKKGIVASGLTRIPTDGIGTGVYLFVTENYSLRFVK
jgi:hypothetical protein